MFYPEIRDRRLEPIESSRSRGREAGRSADRSDQRNDKCQEPSGCSCWRGFLASDGAAVGCKNFFASRMDLGVISTIRRRPEFDGLLSLKFRVRDQAMALVGAGGRCWFAFFLRYVDVHVLLTGMFAEDMPS